MTKADKQYRGRGERMDITLGQIEQLKAFAVILSVLVLGLWWAYLVATKLPDELFMNTANQETMKGLAWDLEVAQSHFDEAVTPGEISASTYEVSMVQARIDCFREKVGLDDTDRVHTKAKSTV